MREPQSKTVARYEILSKVGQGANGVVYRAQDPTIRRVVALKVIPAEATAAAEGTASGRSSASFFEREAQAAGALLHPNIVTLYDAGRDGDWYYLAMEFIEGETYAGQIAREGRIAVERAAEVAAVVAEALDFAHERGVVHRDIKPANLMILPDQTVKVADFGIARLTSSTATMTTDMMVGTPHYMSPEQVRGGKVDGRSDVFSLGIVLYESLTGKTPFAADSLPAILNRILSTTPAPPHEVDPSIPSELSAIVMRAMAREPAERYARGKDLAADLRAFLTARRGESRPLPPVARGSSRWRIAAPALVVAAIAAAGAFALLPRADNPPPAKPGYVQATSEPAGAEVSVDGKVVGRTPYTFEIPEGTHEIEFSKDGYYPAQATIKVPANARVPVELELMARREVK